VSLFLAALTHRGADRKRLFAVHLPVAPGFQHFNFVFDHIYVSVLSKLLTNSPIYNIWGSMCKLNFVDRVTKLSKFKISNTLMKMH
jgi:hypothetical protein